MEGLTVKQQAIWDMKQEGKTQTEIAVILGISVPVVNKTITAVHKKLGLKKNKSEQAVEYKNPERFAAIVDGMTEPLQKLMDAMEANGVPDRAAQALIRRLKTKFFDTVTEVRNLKTIEIDDMLGKKIHLFLSYMDDKVVGEASARDLAMGVAQLIEKRQLLRGEPTQIISDHERKKLNELTPLLIEEARRRGLVIKEEVVVIDAEVKVIDET
jgi:DNA-binding CsgD family transcriptional regulator